MIFFASISIVAHALQISATLATSASQDIAARQETTFLILTPELGDTVGLTAVLRIWVAGTFNCVVVINTVERLIGPTRYDFT